MELYLNFGLIGVVPGMFLLGWLIAFLDRKAAIANASGHLSNAVLYFLPAVPLIQALNSFAELVGGAALAAVAAWGWKLLWTHVIDRMTLGNQVA